MEDPDDILDRSPSDSPEPGEDEQNDTEKPVKKPGSKAKGRKRTKTGCLTCRKRRIKCGEERPTCSNCTKSKRQCEGYNQRVVFKDPMNAYRPTMAQASYALPALGQSSIRRESYPHSGQSPQPIAPKPSGPTGLSMRAEQPPSSSASSYAALPGNGQRNSTHSAPPIQQKQNGRPQPRVKVQLQEKLLDPRGRSHVLERQSPQEQVTHYDFNALVKQGGVNNHAYSPSQSSPSDWSAGPHSAASSQQAYTAKNWESNSPNLFVNQYSDPGHNNTSAMPKPDNFRWAPENEDIPATYLPNWKGKQPISNASPQAPRWSEGQAISPDRPNASSLDAANGPYDVTDDDEDMDMGEDDTFAQDDPQDTHLRNNDLGRVVAVQAGQDRQGRNFRSFVSFIDRPDMLATYVPSSQSTPLQDPMTARIFCHFVNVTGPCMSMYERHPANPSLIFQGTPVTKSQQHIWTYTFPTLALQNPALLHAMLAIASLHISKLQGGPITASYKHYALSLRRLAKSVSLPTRRGHPATLAAALLLAFYECWAADHQKWSDHLLGAKVLAKEIDFAGLTRHIKRQKASKRQQEIQKFHYAQEHGFEFEFDNQSHLHLADEVDEKIVGQLMGRTVSYDEYGQVMEEPVDGMEEKQYTERDVEIYETQRDLFWWYCKQDSYQSILGGGKPFMEYSLWSHCPPRAPLGRLNAIYGTFDHMVLLLGRLADFAARDLKRKRLAIKANGGRWQPPGSTQGQPQASQMPSNHSSPSTPQGQMPNFSGMVPDVKEPRLPMGFEASRDNSPQSTQSEEVDLQSQTYAAKEEWQEIRDAFDLIQSHLGEDFQALGPEYSTPIQTPFGTALQYRTYGIAGIWMNLYMGLIACYRAHPSMPPAAVVAAGIQARHTARFATELGRIAAGIAPDLSVTTEVSPGVGAALVESSTCMFVSAVQLQDAAQRAWTICRLRDIARLTGWQTAHAVLTGCETSWIKMGELGKGPVYVRSKEERVVPDIWASSRRFDRAVEGKSSGEKRLTLEKSDRVQYALGVLGLEEDFAGMDLEGT